MPTIFTPLRRSARSLGLVTLGILSTLGALSLTHTAPVQAQASSDSLASLAARLSADEATIAALKAKTAPLSVSGKDLTITGVNVHIVSGSGTTDDLFYSASHKDTLTGLGNLIIGYNGLRGGKRDVRTGSHNLILGDENNYSSYGGMVAGKENTISSQYASVNGGQNNNASGDNSSISGGFDSTASGDGASISGGESNTASGISAHVGGGKNNLAIGNYSSVSGGEFNSASASLSSVSGGISLKQTNIDGWTGGFYHTP